MVVKGLKDGEHFVHVNINEDLTKTRNTLAYRARQLIKKRFISQTWTVDGKIFVRNNRELVTTITTDYGLKRYYIILNRYRVIKDEDLMTMILIYLYN
jgi:hypothetical protein